MIDSNDLDTNKAYLILHFLVDCNTPLIELSFTNFLSPV